MRITDLRKLAVLASETESAEILPLNGSTTQPEFMWIIDMSCELWQDVTSSSVFPSSLQSELVPSCTQASAQRLAECGQYYDAVPRQNFGSPRYNTGAVWWKLVLLCIIVLCKCVCFVCVSWIYRDGHWWPLHSVYISQHIACLHNFAYHVLSSIQKDSTTSKCQIQSTHCNRPVICQPLLLGVDIVVLPLGPLGLISIEFYWYIWYTLYIYVYI